MSLVQRVNTFADRVQRVRFWRDWRRRQYYYTMSNDEEIWINAGMGSDGYQAYDGIMNNDGLATDCNCCRGV